MAPVSYGLWQRCEHVNVTIMKQGVALGIQADVQICRANRYMRYSPAHFPSCYQIRRHCPVIDKQRLPAGCSCRYLPSIEAVQWLTVLAVVFLVVAVLLLYLKAISSADNGSFDLA
jgi:hypothetical protein